MSAVTFSSLGRVEAISRLLGGTSQISSSSCLPVTGAVKTVSGLFLEGVDFDLVYFPLKHLGYKTISVVTAKLYASLSTPLGLSVTIGVSAKMDFPQIQELWEGMGVAAKEHGYGSVSLDLIPSLNGLSICVAVSGENRIGERPKAKSKDLICISGNIGGAFLGLQVLEREKKAFMSHNSDNSVPQPDLEKYRMMIGSYLRPEIQPSVVSRFREAGIVPSYGYSIDRGLADALKRLSNDSGLGVKVYADRLPLAGNSVSLCKEFGLDPISAAMNGGEDHKLLFCVPISCIDTLRHDFQDYEIIGHLALPEVGTALVVPGGAEFPVTAQGWGD